MASPQAENGHVDIANELIDKFCCYRLSGEEWQCLWVVLRKTYGWRKKEDEISLTTFEKMTGLKRVNVIRALKKLVVKKLLLSSNNATTYAKRYCFNKDFDKWAPSSKKTTPVVKLIMRPVVKRLHSKDNSSKDTIKDMSGNFSPHKEVIDYLNQKLKSKYKVSDTNIKLINGRLAEGFSVDDLKQVVDNTYTKWHDDPKMQPYLRPITIFGKEKFEGYLNMEINNKSPTIAALKKEAIEDLRAKGML